MIKTQITRRQALAGLSSALVMPMSVRAKTLAPATGIFRHGVASGDPDHQSLVIWSRVTTDDSQPRVAWQIAKDASFEKLVDQGQLMTDADRDYTVKVLVGGLKPGQTYYYRFALGSEFSMVGRSKTLPEGHVEKLGIALASCSNFPYGFFNAYDAIAKDPEIDLVLHLGDYIYEYGADGYGAEVGQTLDRNHAPTHEIVSLQDYRQRHAQYKADLASQSMHSAHPLIAIWDDHESTNNPWMQGAQNHQPDSEGAWEPRRAMSLQAYYEWMPIRDPDMNEAGLDMSRAAYWRHFRFGDLASMVALETRHTGRSEQIDYMDYLDYFDSREERDRFMDEVLADPSRNMLSTEMEAFLGASLRESVEAKRPWRLIANQIPMARTHVPSMDHPYFQPSENGEYDPVAEEWAYMLRKGELDLPIYLDPWDGYPAARERFYNLCEEQGARDLLVLTGDSHSFWKNQLFNADGKPMGLELGTTGITSPGDFLLFGPEGAELMDRLLAEHNDEVVWTECRYNGYVRLVLDHQKGRADYVTVSTVLSPEYKTQVLRSENIEPQNGTLIYS